MGIRGRNILGGRLAKSFIASLITAYICQFLNWPPLFAVMTSVISIENTSSDSFKKGLVRFPASAIGAAIAMSLEAFLGQSALAYTLAATLTLFVCTQLKLYDGLVVAVLTAVAMLPVTYGNYLDSFFIRLGTTFTGIAVAIIINYLVLPPNYYSKIQERSDKILRESARWLELFFTEELPAKARLRMAYQKQAKELDLTFKLAHFQRSEWRYHWKGKEKIKRLNRTHRFLEIVQALQHELADLIYFSCRPSLFSGTDLEIIRAYGVELVRSIEEAEAPFNKAYLLTFKEVCDLFERVKEEDDPFLDEHPHLTPRIKLLYDLFDIHDLVEKIKLSYNETELEEMTQNDDTAISDRGINR